jgi:hypothetical protein
VKRVGTWAVALILAVVGGSLATNLSPIRDLYDSLFDRQTFVATGDVVLKRLREQKQLVAATGTFDVPVVVCNGSPEAFDLQEASDEEGRTPAQQLLDSCGGLLDEKATLLASAEVDAVINLAELQADDIDISGTRVSVTLPAVELAEPRIDAEGGMSVIGKEGSFPLIGGELPEDYQARAAGAAKDAVSAVAGGSGLTQMGSRSAESLFTSLLAALGFTEVNVTIASTD